ncbi:repressor of RNA polymerase III transcription MAF1 [Hypoxylon fuscum]|nr:repressor of RNA polymerase III transcription MAF1 [Hypoxylon fuscum]
MKSLPTRDFETVSSSLNFTTNECIVTGSCDLYTTKSAGTDKKLYKAIDNGLEAQHASLLKMSASLSPPRLEAMAASMNLMRSSPFGRLSEAGSRRVLGYMIATLNASHPDYDFSQSLRPSDFRREPHLRRVMANVDELMYSARPLSNTLIPPTYCSYNSSPGSAAVNGVVDMISNPVWSSHMWTLIDEEMTLKDCSIFSYQPDEDPFEGNEAAIWRMHYLFFNKNRKRVTYLYVRGLPNSSALAPHPRGSIGLSNRYDDMGADKRATFWLGDDLVSRIIPDMEDVYDEEKMEVYDPDDDIDIDPLNDPSTDEEDSDVDMDDSEEESEEEDEEVGHCVRGVSEDIIASMEV